uniref:small G protein signaling modulator 2 isoform X1 n=1 Tax=Ciona intestinalis TaxID=7719 RepID=UPI000EF46FA3|nr:small G protein signaling modulator 2 isoform X1 [Ciona intestinalis]|eukprot:XP_026694006.1 small G protein signaling modulator 2 isoform X1 [Ciona intestinalis]
MANETGNVPDEDKHEKLLRILKSQVKAIMEEAVTKKFVHEESPHVLRLCGTVETCFLDGLRKRTAGFLRSNKIASLFTKVGKGVPQVAELVTKIEEIETNMNKPPSQDVSLSQNNNAHNKKHLWIRIALISKILDKIAEHLVDHSAKYYESSSIMANPLSGRLISAILVGPCALDFTKMKTHDHYWSDPPAGELIQRHKLHSRHASPSSPGRRPALHFTPVRHQSSSDSMEKGTSFRDYVESLHQNSKMTLLYGKNNVMVQPQEDIGLIPGYLSLHQEASCMLVKWTPNQLMNVNHDVKSRESSHEASQEVPDTRHRMYKSANSYWEFAISVDVRDIVYLHCHQQLDKSGTLVLVGQDGVQWPPIRFPPGGHLLSFLSCLETGLLPHGHLDPPLWSEKGKGKVFPRLRRKSSRKSTSSTESDEPTDFVFRVSTSSDSSYISSHHTPHEATFDLMKSIFTLPQLWKTPRTKSTSTIQSNKRNSSYEISRSVVIRPAMLESDYFYIQPQKKNSPRIISSAKRCSLPKSHKISEPYAGTWDSSDGYVPHLDMYVYDNQQPRHYNVTSSRNGTPSTDIQSSLKVLCDTMRRQIISRAFYGWLAHCRHLMTVRTHLSEMVHNQVISPTLPTDATRGVNQTTWKEIFIYGKLTSMTELMRHTYFGGVDHDLRPIVWLFLLEHYPPDTDEEDREEIDRQMEEQYQVIMKQWTFVEDIINQRQLKSSERASSCSTSSSESPPVVQPILRQQSSNLSDVFTNDDQQTINKKNIEKYKVIDETKISEGKSVSFEDEHIESSTSSHIPYSSISSTRTDQHSSVSMKSISTDETVQGGGGDVELEGSPETTNTTADDETTDKEVDYTVELLDTFALNLHRIDKDVQRCDRNHPYFMHEDNLVKLRNIMSCYVWKNLEVGYMQGMCDLAAPLLVVLDNESLVYDCFVSLMKRMGSNFPNGGAMDSHFANMRSLIQILDGELFEHMHKNGDYTHFYFCYRWFLLDFKRELSYDGDVFSVWERIWSANYCSSNNFVLFFALAMLQTYRDIILENDMDFTDIIKFFNEMAECHDAEKLIQLAQELVAEVQIMIHK